MTNPVHYESADEDSRRWLGFPIRRGDIVISTRSKSGTTWVQMICALLVFRTPHLPAPLGELSPWLDWKVQPKHAVWDQLAAQSHRRFIKTHTPLDGLPMEPQAYYVVAARHPLDAAVSLYHQGANLDRDRMRELTGAGDPGLRPTLERWLQEWVQWEGPVSARLDSLPGMLWHVGDAWSRRHAANVVLVHYADLLSDLEGEMERLADRLGFDIDPAAVQRLAPHATFESMKRQSDRLAPDPVGVLRDRSRFFRRGHSGAGAAVLSDADRQAYRRRVESLIPPELDAWLHR